LIGKSLTDLFCKNDGPIAVHDAEIYGKRMEMNCVAKDGREFPVELVITKTALSDRELFTLSARDISALKRAEKQVSEFYSVVSHELRTPLTAIRGALGLMEGGMVGDLPEETKEFVSIARVEADRMTRLVNDILDLRKIAAGRLELKLTQCDLAELAKESINAVQSLLSEAQVKVETNLQADCVTYCDRDRIIQIIENLLSNAIKFSPHESTIRVTVKVTEPNYYRIAVQDQGPGIAEDKQEKLFQMFLKLDSSDVRKKGGSGLGLAISKALVEQHGGQIGVISAEGAGAKFWFDLPIKNAPPLQNESVLSSSKNKK
jgi:signal transduction histidine kinase